jgi:hypothetical protein
MKKLRLSVVVLITLFSSLAHANSKAGHHLFNPTPSQDMREFATDRPDKTEAPYTVDAGHFQIETDLFIQTKDRVTDNGSATETTTSSYVFSNLKMGLTHSMDLQVLVAPLVTQEVSSASSPSKTNGFGDTTIRLKLNLLGNDGGDFAWGLMPFVKLPTAKTGLGNGATEGGLIVPFGMSLPNDWNMGWMFQVNMNQNESNKRFHAEWISSITFGHSILGDLSGYVELFSQSSAEANAAWIATFDAGLTYGMTPHLQLDAGLNTGLTEASDDLNPFIGVSARI